VSKSSSSDDQSWGSSLIMNWMDGVVDVTLLAATDPANAVSVIGERATVFNGGGGRGRSFKKGEARARKPHSTEGVVRK